MSVERVFLGRFLEEASSPEEYVFILHHDDDDARVYLDSLRRLTDRLLCHFTKTGADSELVKLALSCKSIHILMLPLFSNI